MDYDYLTLFHRLANDVGLDPYTIGYCIRRIKSEGVKFLTVTLPKLSKAVLVSLEKGFFDRPLGFIWKRKSLGVFSKFLDKIFDRNTGLVLHQVDALSLYQLRQVCDYFYKLSLPYSDSQVEAYTEAFIATDNAIDSDEQDEAWVEKLRKRFETHFPCFTSDSVDAVLKRHLPRSGPGTFSHCTPSDKPWWLLKHSDYAVHKACEPLSWASRPISCAPSPTIVNYDLYSELLFVPKDSRGPRTIVREPYHTLRYQMAFNSYLSSSLEKVTKHRINFRNQLVNRSLAERASQDRRNATLDLKDASDSVSYKIMRRIFSNAPALRWFLRCRTDFVRLPDGRLHKLKKLSGMGSGFTFPSMSLLIYLSACEAISSYGTKTFKQAMDMVYVYGDDLVVPRVYLPRVEQALRRSGLKLNRDKSFSNSYFRESCGGDYYCGQEVTPIRLRLSSCENAVNNKKREIRVQGKLAYLQVERHCRELVKAGLLRLADYFYSKLESKIGRLPAVAGESPVMGRYTLKVPDYPMDDVGHYRPVRCIIPVPHVQHVGEQADPYVFLANALRNVGTDSVGQTYGEVALPRSVRYRRTSVSAFRLMG